MLRSTYSFSVATILCAGWLSLAANGQGNPPPTYPSITSPQPAANDPREAARQQILLSQRWQQAVRNMNQWLSIQQLYSPQEVAVLRSEFHSRVARMSPEELEKQLNEIEAKLAILASPEAEDARRWMAQFLAVQAKYSEAELRARRPDVARMTASQIQQELANFQKRRGGMQMSQAAVQQGRALQVQNAQNMQAQRQQAAERARQSASRAADVAASRNQIQTNTNNVPPFSGPQYNSAPFYTVGPWGNPIRWDARTGFW